MKPSDVITMDSQNRGIDPKKVLVGIQGMVKKGGLVLHQDGTVLALQRLAQGVFMAHLFTVDQPLALSKALVSFFRQMQNKGVRRLYGRADNQGIISLLKQLGQREGVQVQQSDLPKFNWMIEL